MLGNLQFAHLGLCMFEGTLSGYCKTKKNTLVSSFVLLVGGIPYFDTYQFALSDSETTTAIPVSLSQPDNNAARNLGSIMGEL